MTEFVTVIGMFTIFVLCVATVGVTTIIRTLKSPGTPESNAAEAEMIQDMHRSMMKMEERVEALETILLDVERARSSQRQTEGAAGRND